MRTASSPLGSVLSSDRRPTFGSEPVCGNVAAHCDNRDTEMGLGYSVVCDSPEGAL